MIDCRLSFRGNQIDSSVSFVVSFSFNFLPLTCMYFPANAPGKSLRLLRETLLLRSSGLEQEHNPVWT